MKILFLEKKHWNCSASRFLKVKTFRSLQKFIFGNNSENSLFIGFVRSRKLRKRNICNHFLVLENLMENIMVPYATQSGKPCWNPTLPLLSIKFFGFIILNFYKKIYLIESVSLMLLKIYTVNIHLLINSWGLVAYIHF